MQRMQWYMGMLGACFGTLFLIGSAWNIITEQWMLTGIFLALTAAFISMVQVRPWSPGSTKLTTGLMIAFLCLLFASIMGSYLDGDVVATVCFLLAGVLAFWELVCYEVKQPAMAGHAT
ncbi:MAG: hypothetical protein M3N59_02640 [bacterium]|nr:hypothetical protein [bacterium]